MKKKRVTKVEKVKQQEVPTDEVTAQKTPQKVNPFQAWDNLMFMRRPHPQENSKEHSSSKEDK
ncbi:MAG: hypothetical protein ACK4M9_20435 [Anaerobacillus sp.]|uniref:hypothetical protein n=1 Tax=Anaerobacillus sp. TaxID=1872506 RepID=UPI00391876EA